MKKRRILLLVGLLVSTVLFAFAACTNPKEPTAYALSETSISLTVGGEKRLTISPDPEVEVSWESGNDAVATVENGLVRAIAAGSAIVTATIEGAEAPLTCTVTVTEEQNVEPQAQYELDVTSASLKTGETLQLTVLDKDGNAVQSVTYSSDDSAIASVSEIGLITAVAAGNTQIKAKVGSETLICEVTVAQSYNYSLNKTALDIAVGASERITLIVTPEGTSARPHTFSSSDLNVASVDGGTGKVTGIGKGSAVITCLVDGEELTASVTVTEYTLTVGGAAWSDTVELRMGETKDIAITADPAHNLDAVYHSDNEQIITVEDGRLVPVSTGATNVTVTIGGRTWTTAVTVRNAVEYAFEQNEITLKLGESGTLTVVSDPISSFEVSFESGSPDIVSVTSEGSVATVTGTGLGDATVTARIAGADNEITATVHVVFGVEQSEVDYKAGENYSVNLDTLDETYETIDWVYYGKNDYTDRKNGGSLLGMFTGTKALDFTDYRVGINWSDGTTTAKNFNDRTDGITLKNGSFTVKVTKDVKYISVFTGVYHGTNTISISYNGTVCVSYTFENNGDNDGINKNKQIVFTPDVQHLIGDEMEFTISFEVGAESSHGWTDNISLVAVAVIGNTERSEDVNPPAATGSATVTPFSELGGGDVIDLTAVGTLDWVYAKNGNDGGLVRKDSSTPLILEKEITTTGGDGYDWIGVKKFHWTDGTEAAASNAVNNFQWINERYQIPVHLTEGHYEITLYLSGWKCSYFFTVLDENSNTIVATTRAVQGDGNNSQQAAVKVILDVTAESTFFFNMTKEGDGNHGWAAIAVSDGTSAPDIPETYELSDTALTLQAGKDAETATLVVYDGKGKEVSGVTFESSNVFVANVDNQTGVVTAVGIGQSTITVYVDNSILTCIVTVIIPDAELSELDYDIENLSRASSEYKTIDYKHWNNGATVVMPNGADLIGEPEFIGGNGNFWDYKGSIGYEFNAGSNRNLGMSYGKVSNESFTIRITINNGVSGIVFYTGAYNGTAVITFRLGEQELATVSFTAANDGTARKIMLKFDTSSITGNQTLTIEGRVENKGASGNVNVNAVAVIGKEAQSSASATGSAAKERLGDTGSNKVDLTEEGSLDWIYSHYEGDKVDNVFPTYRKYGGTVFTGETYYNENKETANPGQEWDGRSAFKWTDGYRSDDAAAIEGTANPTDQNEGWEGHGEYTNNYNTAAGEIHIGMHLTAGTYTIKLYLNSWKADLAAAIYDGGKNFIAGKVCLSNEPNDGSGWVVTFTLEVTEEDDFTLVIGKVRSHDDGGRQVGWQAVSVAKNDD